MGTKDDTLFLSDMRDAATQILDYASGRKVGDMDGDPMLRDAILRQLEVLGEAASRVSEKTRKKAGDIPWRQIVGMRNELIHAYHRVDDEAVWRTIEEELPLLLKRVALAHEKDHRRGVGRAVVWQALNPAVGDQRVNRGRRLTNLTNLS